MTEVEVVDGLYSEALAIPASVRAVVDERDQRHCRLCGVFDQYREIHHLIFGGTARGMGGRRLHNPDEMVSLCKRCHMRAHSEKSVWVKWLLLAIEHSGTTALQQRRWAAAKSFRFANGAEHRALRQQNK